MKKLRYLLKSFLAINLLCLFALALNAQGRHGGRGGYGGRYNSFQNYVSIGSNFRGYNYNRLNYGQHYNYHLQPQYRSVYNAPYNYSHFGPAFGFRINVLPFGYNRFFIGNDPFFYYQGVYYRPYNYGGYVVTAPPLGATVKHLPSGVKVTVINAEKFYELGGTFYQEEMSATNNIQYRVVGTKGVINTVEQEGDEININKDDKMNGSNYTAPVTSKPFTDGLQQGQKINQLPVNSKVVLINNQKLYVTPNGIYYQEIVDTNNNISYLNVGEEDISKEKK